MCPRVSGSCPDSRPIGGGDGGNGAVGDGVTNVTMVVGG